MADGPGRHGISAGMGKKLPLLLFLLIATGAAATVLLWRSGFFLPGWVVWHDRTLISENGLEISLDHRTVTVRTDDGMVWRTKKGWYAQEALLYDVDRDGAQDLVIVCWKHGSYGKHRPTWVKRDTVRFSQHVFLYRLEADAVRPFWMSSALNIQIADCMADAAGRLVIEGPAHDISKWGWLDWGLERME